MPTRPRETQEEVDVTVHDEQHDANTGPGTVPARQQRRSPMRARFAVIGLTVGLIAAGAPVASASASALPTNTTKACDNPYTVAKGDGWIAIAKRAGVTTKQLLKANKATAKTKIHPGGTICLPKGAAVSAAPAKSKATTPAPPAAAAPSAGVQVRTYTAAEVEAIIRQVWPDELEEKAIEIATRESKLKPTARNWCCSGLFQIYYGVHHTWLAGIGVTSADQLLDPTVNANAAYALYQRAGSWKPWGG